MCAKRNTVLNNTLGSHYAFGDIPKFNHDQWQNVLADIFEQLMIFDSVTLTANRTNVALWFLLSRVGIDSVERMLEANYLHFILWSPIIVMSSGMQREDGSIDESAVMGQPPIVAGQLGDDDLDPELNIQRALAPFGLHKRRQRSFIKKALRHYTIPDGMLVATDAAKLVIDSYKNNDLEYLGLPMTKDPEQMTVAERGKLLDLGNAVTETAILSQYGMKSYENYEAYSVCKKNLENIGKGYNMSGNTSRLFNLENLPDLKELFKAEHLDFDTVFKLRHLPIAKNYRKWIDEVGQNGNQQEVTAEYLNAIRGDSKFFEKTGGKFLKNLLSFGASFELGAAVTHAATLAAGVAAAAVAVPTAGYLFGLLDTFLIDSIVKGKNPSMFINRIKIETTPEATLYDLHPKHPTASNPKRTEP